MALGSGLGSGSGLGLGLSSGLGVGVGVGVGLGLAVLGDRLVGARLGGLYHHDRVGAAHREQLLEGVPSMVSGRYSSILTG